MERLFEVIHRLKAKGVSILYVSHHLDEVFELADRVTVLRDGRRIATRPGHGLDHDGLVELIVGHRLEEHTSRPRPANRRRAVLSVRGLRGDTVRELDLDVGQGEIVGLAGITGSGREDVLALIAGQIPREDGDVWIDDEPIPNYDPHHGDRRRCRLRPGRARRARHGRAR